MAIAGRFFLNLGGTVANVGAIRWGFRAPANAYDEIGAGLGVSKVDDTNRTGISYGINQPRPARVRISYSESPGQTISTTRHAIRFCEPDNLNDVLFGSINGKSINIGGITYPIQNVTIK